MKFLCFNHKINNRNEMVKVISVKRKNQKYELIHLRPWQKELKKEYIEQDKSGLVINAATGAGKTVTLLTILTDSIKNDNRKVIVSVPQLDISRGFTKGYRIGNSYIKVEYNNCFDTGNKLEGIVTFLERKHSDKANPNLRIGICSHPILIELYKQYPDLLKNTIIVIDEAHHVSNTEEYSNQLGGVIKFAENNKSITPILLTATFFRGDSSTIIYNNSKYFTYKLPFDKYLKYCYFLSGMKYSIDITDKELQHSISDNINPKDKTVVFVPRTGSTYCSLDKYDMNKKSYIEDIITNLSDDNKFIDNKNHYQIMRNNKPFIIVDLVSDDSERRSHESFLYSNKKKVNMVLTMCMFREGSNWEYANKVVIIGVRNSLTEVAQMIGRGTRDHSSKGINSITDVVQIIPQVMEDELKENAREEINKYLQNMYCALLMELIVRPLRLKITLKKIKKGSDIEIPNVDINEDGIEYTSLFNNNNEVIEFEKEIDTEVGIYLNNNKELNQVERTVGQLNIIKEKIAERFNEILSEESIKLFANEFFNRRIEKSEDAIIQIKRQKPNFSQIGIDLDIDYNMLETEIKNNGILGYNYLFATAVWGVKTFQEYREKILRLTGEAASNEMCHKVCQWIIENKRNPSNHSKNLIEKQYGNWLSAQKTAKQNNGINKNRRLFYNSNQIIAESYGLPNLFELNDYIQQALENCKLVCDYVDEHWSVPINKLGAWIVTQRQAKKGKKSNIYPEVQEYAENRGYKYLFENDSIFNYQLACKWWKENNKKPSQHSKNLIERSFGWKLQTSKKDIKNRQVFEHIKNEYNSEFLSKSETIENNFREICKEKGYIILGKYINTQTKIKLKCMKDGKVWNPTPKKIISGGGCPVCAIELRKEKIKTPLSEIEKYVKQFGVKLLPNQIYKNNRQKLKLKCKCGKVFERIFTNIKRQNPYCSSACNKKYNPDLRGEK